MATKSRTLHIPHFMQRRGMLHMYREKVSKGTYKDNLSFFRCLAHFLYKKPTKYLELFQTFYENSKRDIGSYQGLQISEIDLIESKFNVMIDVYTLCPQKNGKGTKIETRRKHKGLEVPNLMSLNLHGNHYSLIVDLKKYEKIYTCEKCHRLFTSLFNYKRHIKIKKPCTKTSFVYKGGIFRNSKTIFRKLYEANIIDSPRTHIYPYFTAFDFEVYFKALKSSSGKGNSDTVSTQSHTVDHCYSKQQHVPVVMTSDPTTSIEYIHVPLSAAVASNFPKYRTAAFFLRQSECDKHFVNNVLDYITSVSVEIGSEMVSRYSVVLDKLDCEIMKQNSIELETIKQTEKETPLQRLKRELLKYLLTVPVLGFNSSKYDLNIMKQEFHDYFLNKDQKDISTIKRGNQYIAVITENCIFLDIFNYLAPGYNYATYLKAFLNNECKGHFPYEWMTELRKLSNKRLPPREAFFSSLKNTNISDEEYQDCIRIWKEKGMTNMKDYLRYYNTQDVEPFISAIERHREFFTERGIDMFKDGSTLPGLTLRFLFDRLNTSTTVPYILFSSLDADLHDMVRNNLVGGPSIIFHRYHSAGSTKIRHYKYNQASKTCQHILGVDANSLYLKCMGEMHCSGYFITYREEKNYKPQKSQQISCAATEWLRYISIEHNTEILHKLNHGEISIGVKQIPVDGYSPRNKTIYQFHGCYWHGHICLLTEKSCHNSDDHDLLKARALRTEKITRYLKSIGYKVIEQRECEWYELKKTFTPEKNIDQWTLPKLKKHKFTDVQSIVDAITDDQLFGLVEVDITTPEELKGYFEEMTPIFKHADVSREDVGDHMKRYLEETNTLTRPRKQLIGSYYGIKILLGTPLLHWYLKKGLKVTRVYTVVQYNPDRTFLPFVNEVTEARRSGDLNKESKIMSDLYKLLGNSSYGKTICNKINFTRTTYTSLEKASKIALHWSVINMEELSDTTVEITQQPMSVKYDLPIQIGFMVYQYAKLKMLQFYYDFLDKYIDRRDYELCEMDTDSLYFAISAGSIDELVPEDLKEQYYSERHLWLPAESCDIDYHRETYIKSRTYDIPYLPLPCCRERFLYDKRTPGLFKVEWEGKELTSLNSKCYIGTGTQGNKQSCKGVIQSQNELNAEAYTEVLVNKSNMSVKNKSFKVNEHKMVTYTQKKRGLTYTYIKRKTLDDGVSTAPLDV